MGNETKNKTIEECCHIQRLLDFHSWIFPTKTLCCAACYDSFRCKERWTKVISWFDGHETEIEKNQKITFPNGRSINQQGRKSYVFYQKNLWNCNVMKFKTMREEQIISSLMATGRKWFFPPSWSQISWYCNFTCFYDKRHNIFFPIVLLLAH